MLRFPSKLRGPPIAAFPLRPRARSRRGLVLGVGVLAVVALGFAIVRPRPDPAVPAGDDASGGGPATRGAPAPADGAPLAAAAVALRASIDVAALDPAREVSGTVVDEQGAPVAGARIEASVVDARVPFDDPARATVVGAATAARDGSFAVRLAPSASALLVVTARGFAPAEVDDARPGEARRIVLSRGVTWSLQVVGPTGAAVAEATVDVLITDARTFAAPYASRTTDAAGRAIVTGLPPRRPAWAVVRHPDFAPASPTPCERMPAAGALETRILLDAGQVLEGVVVDGVSGAPVVGARVGCSSPPRDGATTGRDGRFRLPHAPAGTQLSLFVVAPGDPSTARGTWYAVSAVQPIELRLPRAFGVDGRVVRPGGAPVAGVEVAALGAGLWGGHDKTRTETDPDGRFHFEGLRADLAYDVVVRPPGLTAAARPIEAPDPHAARVDLGELVVDDGGRIAGRVVHADGRPAIGVDVERSDVPIDDPPGFRGWRRSSTDANVTGTDGTFAFEGVALGEHRLRARVRGGPTRTAVVTVVAGAPSGPVTIALPSLRRIPVAVVDDAGEPVPTARVSGRPGEDDGDGNAVPLDAEGRGVAWVTPTTLGLAVVVYGAGLGDHRRFSSTGRFVALPTTDDEVRVVVPRARTVRGRVVGVDGSPVPRALVTVEGASDQHVCGDDGAFAIDTDAAGPVTVRFDGAPDHEASDADPAGLFAEVRDVDPDGDEVVLRALPPAAAPPQTVHVLDPDGRPVEGASVVHGLGGRWESTSTDAVGRATVTGLRLRPYRWEASATVDGIGLRSAERSATPGTTDLVLRLERPRWLRGRVAIPRGVARAYVRVVLLTVRATGLSRDHRPVEDDGGTFAIDLRAHVSTSDEGGGLVVIYAEAGPRDALTHRGPRVPVAREPVDEVVLTLEPLR